MGSSKSTWSQLMAAASMLGVSYAVRRSMYSYEVPKSREVNSNRGRKAQMKLAMTTKERVEARKAVRK